MVSLKLYRRDHLRLPGGPMQPECEYRRSLARYRDSDLVRPGGLWSVLEEAGLTTRLVGLHKEYRNEEYVDEKTGEVKYRFIVDKTVTFVGVVPEWSLKLVRALTHNGELSRALGYRKRRRLTNVMKDGQRIWAKCDQPKPVPRELVVRVLRAAAASPLAREMVAEDPHAAVLILRDAA